MSQKALGAAIVLLLGFLIYMFLCQCNNVVVIRQLDRVENKVDSLKTNIDSLTNYIIN